MEKDGSQDIAAEIFAQEDPIFRNKSLVEVEHVPSPERIVGRDDEIRALSTELRSAVNGDSPENVILYGETGTGKSLVAKHVAKAAKSNAGDVRIGTVYVDCSTDDTETQAISSIARTLNEEAVTDIRVPETGLAKAAYYTRLYAILDRQYDVVIIILDEADMHPDDQILMSLSRAVETGKTDCRIGLIAISNKVRWAEDLNDRVKSSLQPRELNFHSYDANQLRAILSHRRDAFREGVLSDDVIPLCAAYAAQDHGDARQAIDVLRNAGMLAQRDGSDVVTRDHVEDAKMEAEKDRFRDLIGGLTVQKKLVLSAVTALHKGTDDDEFSMAQIIETYTKLCEATGTSTRSDRRVRDFVRRLAFLDILELRKQNLGRAGGITIYARLQPDHDLDIVHQTAMDDEQFVVDDADAENASLDSF